jgi:hypothetical protein
MEESVRSSEQLRREGRDIAATLLEAMGGALFDGTKQGILLMINADVESSDGTRDEIPERLRGAAEFFEEIARDLRTRADEAEKHR